MSGHGDRSLKTILRDVPLIDWLGAAWFFTLFLMIWFLLSLLEHALYP